jgi:rubrerythrin
MEWGDPSEALRAEVERAKHQNEKVRARARAEQERAAKLRDADREGVEAARSKVESAGGAFRCRRCNAVWEAEAVAETMRREPRCLLCGGPVAPVP